MNESLATVIGMTIAYVASLLGLLLAWYGYRKHGRGRPDPGPDSDPGDPSGAGEPGDTGDSGNPGESSVPPTTDRPDRP